MVAFLNLKNHNFIQIGMAGWASAMNKYNEFVVDSQPLIPHLEQKEKQHEY